MPLAKLRPHEYLLEFQPEVQSEIKVGDTVLVEAVSTKTRSHAWGVVVDKCSKLDTVFFVKMKGSNRERPIGLSRIKRVRRKMLK